MSGVAGTKESAKKKEGSNHESRQLIFPSRAPQKVFHFQLSFFWSQSKNSPKFKMMDLSAEEHKGLQAASSSESERERLISLVQTHLEDGTLAKADIDHLRHGGLDSPEFSMPGPGNKRLTALQAASVNGDIDAIRLLLENQANPNVAGPKNTLTCLELAIVHARDSPHFESLLRAFDPFTERKLQGWVLVECNEYLQDSQFFREYVATAQVLRTPKKASKSKRRRRENQTDKNCITYALERESKKNKTADIVAE